MKPIKTHKLRDHVWKIKDNVGLDVGELAMCLPEIQTLEIPVEGDTREELDWIIHESLHACYLDMAEEAVESAATDIARLLWRLGWRKEVD